MRLTAAEARARVSAARVARLATVSAEGVPHLVPVTFAVLGPRIVFVVDDKPKSTMQLRRLDNISACPLVCLLVDVYDDDWSRLWVRHALDGTAAVLETDAEAVDALAARYPAYVRSRPRGPVVSIDVTNWAGWAALDTLPGLTDPPDCARHPARAGPLAGTSLGPPRRRCRRFSSPDISGLRASTAQRPQRPNALTP